MSISDWSSDVCSSDLRLASRGYCGKPHHRAGGECGVPDRRLQKSCYNLRQLTFLHCKGMRFSDCLCPKHAFSSFLDYANSSTPVATAPGRRLAIVSAAGWDSVCQ